ncbi:beta-1,3-galactosyltransferase 1-like [Gigantopelta aegis]|uniref:beta-1,3-galactosyltransferase 1-like n=1 Tax=Gigantopelta aegis TaxID=1735272 RepID=UPI001B88B287|nr:beta-1,3-galactosyltransferase 1-like [Gigantopelta aegis]
MEKPAVQFLLSKIPVKRLRTIYKYFAVISFTFVSAVIIVQFFGNRTVRFDDVIRGEKSPSRGSNMTPTSTVKATPQTYLPVEGPVVNPHPFRYLLNPETFCNKKDIYIITYVHSAPSNFEKRDAIRQTWGKRKYYLNKRVELVFILGQVADTEVMTSVRNESDIHGDIVQEDFVDSYRNLTYKAIAGLKWVSTFCRQAVYVLKTDDDIFVNLYVFIRYILSTVEFRYGMTRLILCHVWVNMGVIRKQQSKWYLSRDDFSPDFFPPYCSGSAYLMSPDVTEAMYRLSLTTNMFWVDDVYITGLLIQNLNITHRPFNTGYIFYPSLFVQELETDKYYDVAVYVTHNLQRMFLLWTTVNARESKAVDTKNISKIAIDFHQNTS